MKKKIFLSLFVIVSLFIITGCNDEKQDENISNETYSLGDTIETDVMKLKLLAGKYTYALVNTSGDSFALPKEYDPSKDLNSAYVASKGHTYAAFSFYVENLDRASIDFGGSFNAKFTSISYNNENYSENAKFVASSTDNLNWSSYSSENILLLAGKKGYYRAYVDIPVDVNSLDDTLEITFNLLASGDKIKSFKYVVTADDRKNYKDDEIDLDVAIKNLNKQIAKEYFKNHINEYSVLKGDEIKNVIEGKKYNVIEVKQGSWKGTFTFETSGKIYEKSDNGYAVGYVNNRTWNISGNILNLSWVNDKGETKTESYEVKKVKDNTYLLVEDDTIYGILY